MKSEREDHGRKTVELRISGHPVTLAFASKPDPAAVKHVRDCLIDAYIRRRSEGCAAS